jgi:hypothetical protein
MTICKWPLGNGELLEFTIYYGPKTTWNEVAGLFIFTCLDDQNIWRAIYVGQTDNFSSCLPSHALIDEAVQNGATHIHALVVPLAADRDKWEKMLIQNLQPQLNARQA